MQPGVAARDGNFRCACNFNATADNRACTNFNRLAAADSSHNRAPKPHIHFDSEPNANFIARADSNRCSNPNANRI